MSILSRPMGRRCALLKSSVHGLGPIGGENQARLAGTHGVAERVFLPADLPRPQPLI